MKEKPDMYTRLDFTKKEARIVRTAASRAMNGLGLPVRTYCKKVVLTNAAKVAAK